MTTAETRNSPASINPVPLVIALLLVVVMGFLFREGLTIMVGKWNTAEYGHGYVIPIIAFLLIYKRLDALKDIPLRGSWLGTGLTLLGVAIACIGELSTIFYVIQYGFVVALIGAIVSIIGTRAALRLWVPLAYLCFMVPLPQFLYFNLSHEMQFISSELGVVFVRLFGISVYLEGNIIDLGIYKLQVVEACNGLRYLFPLMSFGFLFAYLYQGPFWHKAVIFISTVPITILMNSFRIGVIGLLVDNYGIEHAEGFLHAFEGWVIFMACVVILFILAWALQRLSGARRPLAQSLDLEPPRWESGPETLRRLELSKPLIASAIVLVASSWAVTELANRNDTVPSRLTFAAFPVATEGWSGRRSGLDREILDTLGLTDYLFVDYTHPDENAPINYYISYYDSQRKGESVHSPRACIPGDGWRIVSHTQRSIEGVRVDGQAITVNEVLISRGNTRQLVYYWFDQRGRQLVNQWQVKWHLLVDGIATQRTDGAMLRLVTPVRQNESADQASRRLERFMRVIVPRSQPFLPVAPV